jgi:hypothetical protein
MRADRPRWAGWRREGLLDFGERKDLDVLTAPVIHPRSSERAPCDINPTDRGQDSCLKFHRGRSRKQVTNGADAARLVSFRSSCQALFTQGTVPTIFWHRHIHCSLGRGIFLTHFTQPEGCPSRTADRDLIVLSENTGWDLIPTTVSSPLPGAVGFCCLLGRGYPWGPFRCRGPLHLAQFASLYGKPQRKPDIPHPLARDLPELLTALGVGTPAIRIFFEIFLGEERLKCPRP